MRDSHYQQVNMVRRRKRHPGNAAQRARAAIKPRTSVIRGLQGLHKPAQWPAIKSKEIASGRNASCRKPNKHGPAMAGGTYWG
jgi:hypothetical protein